MVLNDFSKEFLTIALADDDEDDRMLFEMALEKTKIKNNLHIFKNGKDLIEYLYSDDHELPELIFLDLNMPVLDGMECLKLIRKNKKMDGISIAIYSTSSSERDIEQTFICGANIYINKPNSFDALKKAVHHAIKINWQYQNSNLDRDNFLLRL